uniref:Uncharacterized protein n=1 Tax=Candidatus Methanophagaceae archaeon ANME-1 ERB6 TaxID=2759912 RepID=A0A7G9YU75_9EURY|nr:hypothetical protein FJOHDBIG_00007 [Methanosarcinales archaeon ANME-1 ERB6]
MGRADLHTHTHYRNGGLYSVSADPFAFSVWRSGRGMDSLERTQEVERSQL